MNYYEIAAACYAPGSRKVFEGQSTSRARGRIASRSAGAQVFVTADGLVILEVVVSTGGAGRFYGRRADLWESEAKAIASAKAHLRGYDNTRILVGEA